MDNGTAWWKLGGKSKIPETGSPRLCPPPLPSPSSRRQRTLLSPIFAFRPRFGRQSARVARKLSFNFPRNSNKVGRPSRVLGPGRVHASPSPRPGQHFKLAFHWLVRRNFIRPGGGKSNRVSRVWSPATGQPRAPSKRDSDADARFGRERKVSVAGLSSGPASLELPTALGIVYFWTPSNPPLNDRGWPFIQNFTGRILHCSIYCRMIIVSRWNEEEIYKDVYKERERKVVFWEFSIFFLWVLR